MLIGINTYVFSSKQPLLLYFIAYHYKTILSFSEHSNNITFLYFSSICPIAKKSHACFCAFLNIITPTSLQQSVLFSIFTKIEPTVLPEDSIFSNCNFRHTVVKRTIPAPIRSKPQNAHGRGIFAVYHTVCGRSSRKSGNARYQTLFQVL